MTAHGPSRGRLRWKLRYIREMCRAYASLRHERESRKVFLAVFVSLLESRWGPYEATGIRQRLLAVFDSLLVFLMKGARTLKRFVRGIGKGGRTKRGGGLLG